jgi:hypothetical protein
VVRACVDAGAQSISTVLLHLRPGVKEVFLSRLTRTHPHLVSSYQQRYGERAYAPRAEQQELDTLVRELVRRHGGVAADRLDPRHHTGEAGTPDDDSSNDPLDDETTSGRGSAMPSRRVQLRRGRRPNRPTTPEPLDATQLTLL